jgi:hypothetical protein
MNNGDYKEGDQEVKISRWTTNISKRLRKITRKE